MNEYILHREIPISGNKRRHPEKWVIQYDNETSKFFIKGRTLPELVKLIIKKNISMISKSDLSTISSLRDCNENYKQIPASSEELGEFYRLYEESKNHGKE